MTTTSSSNTTSPTSVPVFGLIEVGLLANQITPFVQTLTSNAWQNWTIAATHNHYTNETPEIIFVHAYTMGNLTQVEGSLWLAIHGLDAILGPTPINQTTIGGVQSAPTLGCSTIAGQLGGVGMNISNICAVNVTPSTPITGPDGLPMNNFTTLGSMFDFVPTASSSYSSTNANCSSNENVTVVGMIATPESTLGSVESAIIPAGFNISSIVNHMILTNPPMLYIHFTATGQLWNLTSTIGSALAAANNSSTSATTSWSASSSTMSSSCTTATTTTPVTTSTSMSSSNSSSSTTLPYSTATTNSSSTNSSTTMSVAAPSSSTSNSTSMMTMTTTTAMTATSANSTSTCTSSNMTGTQTSTAGG